LITTTSAAGEATDPYCLRDGESARCLAGHPWRRFGVLGDSIAEGLGGPTPGYPDVPWADRIAAELRGQCPQTAYLNLGRRNTPIAQVRAGQLGRMLAFRPDLALAACGGYDVLRPGFDPAAVRGHLRAVVGALREAGAEVMTVGMFDGSFSPLVPHAARAAFRRRLHELAALTRQVAEEFGTLHVDLVEHPASLCADIYSSDGRHGSARSHAISAAEAVRRLGLRLAAGSAPGAPEDGAPEDCAAPQNTPED
jgi:lysophospholipase L1-like esterase